MSNTTRPAFSSFEAFTAHAEDELSHWPMTSSMRWEVVLAGVAMSLDYHRGGRVTFVGILA